MATSARLFGEAMTLEWIVLAEDYPNMQKKRAEIRPKHVEYILPRTHPETGMYSMGGITLSEAPILGEPLQITGVAAVVQGNSREEVLEEIKKDPYYTNGIWDPSKIQIIPFICAVRNAGGYHGK